MRFITALLAGLLFGGGLLLSGMTNPGTVLAFLDIGGEWNPALAFTMGGAIAVAAPVFFHVRRRGRSLAGETVRLPVRTGLTASLIAGAAIFGLGWGLSGICPGPGLILLTALSVQSLVFVGAMAAGMTVATALPRISQAFRRQEYDTRTR
jgi:uncharacterized membrane protein YedE/YeeE